MPVMSPLSGLMTSENHTSRNGRHCHHQHQHNRRNQNHGGSRPRHPNLIQSLNAPHSVNADSHHHQHDPDHRRSARRALTTGGSSVTISPQLNNVIPQQTTTNSIGTENGIEPDDMQPLLLSEKPEKDSKPEDYSTNDSMTNMEYHNHHHHPGFQSYFNFRHSNRNPFSYFARNVFGGGSGRSRLGRNSDPRIARSVTLLMTKGELSQFGFNYLQDNLMKEEDHVGSEGMGNNDTGSIHNLRDRDEGHERRILQHQNSSHSFLHEIMDGGSGDFPSNSTTGLAPSYSQALLLMEPSRNRTFTAGPTTTTTTATHGFIHRRDSSHISPNSNEEEEEQQRDLIQEVGESRNNEHSEFECPYRSLSSHDPHNLMRNSTPNHCLHGEIMSYRSIRSDVDSGGGADVRSNFVRDGHGNLANFSQPPQLTGMGFGSEEQAEEDLDDSSGGLGGSTEINPISSSSLGE
jgi:hypothetical protein